MKQLRKREAAERRAAAESQMDANLIPLGERPVRRRHEAGSRCGIPGSSSRPYADLLMVACGSYTVLSIANTCSVAVAIALVAASGQQHDLTLTAWSTLERR